MEKPTVAILYGFCEGPRLAGRFLRALTQAGYRVIDDVERADVIITHSGGCFMLSESLRAKKIILIGLTYWPGKSMVKSSLQKNWNDFQYHLRSHQVLDWLHKFKWNLVYFWNMPYNFRMLRGRKKGDFWKAQHITLIRNDEDSFCTPDVQRLPFAHAPKVVLLPGQHDDCWLHPERYIAVIQ